MPRTRAPDGVVLGWHEAGDGPGPPVVLLPGLSLGRISLAPLQLHRARRTLAVDPRGVAASRPCPPHLLRGPSLDDAADDVVRVLDAAGVAQADLVALSFGGAVAQRLLVRHPDRLRRVALLSSPTGHRPERVAYVQRLLALADAGDLRGAWALLGPQLVRPSLGRPLAPALRAAGRLVPPLVLRTSAPALAGQLAALLALPDDRVEEVAGRPHPVLLVHGERDRLAPLGDAERLRDLLPGARLHVVARAGHLAPLRLREVRPLLLEHLAG